MTTTQPAARTGKDAHTPTPWHIEEQTNSVGELFYFSVEHPGRPYRGTVCNAFSAEHIGGITESEARANADLIVRAVNSHAALVAALEAVENFLTWGDARTPAWQRVAELAAQARAALAAAKGGAS